MMKLSRTTPAATLLALLCAATPPAPAAADDERAAQRIQPYAKNPRYWQYQGEPTLLLGGSKDDNLFQLPDLEQHLRLLASVGGNYVRNVMTGRDEGNVQPFARRTDGRYDLEQWDEEYWRRFERLLRLSRELNIVVQIEVWDRFDYAREQWAAQPFNPKNNVNYTYAEAGFAETYPDHPGRNQQPFFYTTPKQRNNKTVLRSQQRFVDEMLRRSLPYPNVLYCIDNETSGDPAWGAYWADYIRTRARAAGVRVFITQMWDEWNLKSEQHRHTLDHPERYDFVDLSQNNHQRGENHWANFQWARSYIGAKPRPINTVKTYGADTHHNRTSLPGSAQWWRRMLNRPAATNTPQDYGTTQHGTERWWRHLIGGAAGVRFHRPSSGIGLSTEAQQHIRSARLLLKEFDIVRAEPDAEHALLSERRQNEAYLTRIDGEAYAVYFPDGGAVRLALPSRQKFRLKWLNIAESRWSGDAVLDGDGPTRLAAPARGQWLALLTGK